MSRSRVLGIAAVATALLGVMLAAALNLWLSAKAYEPLATMQSLVVIANFSDGSTSPSLMYKMINNPYHSALRDFVTLEQPPYPVVDVKLFNNTLVTFELPSGFKYRYASIVIHGNRIYVYEFNSAQDYKLYTVVSEPIASVTIEIKYPKTEDGNATLSPVGTLNAKKFEVPLPGTNAKIIVYHLGYTAEVYSELFGQLAARTTAAGWFFIVPYREVSSVVADGSARAGFGYSLCTSNAPGATNGVGSYATQVYVQAGYAANLCPVTRVIFMWPWVGMDAAGNVYTPTSFPVASSLQVACVCSGASFTFQFLPPIGR